MLKAALVAVTFAQTNPNDGGRRPLNVNNFESQSALDYFSSLSDDYDSSTPDYEVEYNVALDDYTYDNYDGGAGDSAGRPDSSVDDQVKDLSTGISVQGHNNNYKQCLKCSGQTAEACKTADVLETCNDAQDACQVEVRSQYQGGSIVHKFYSGCRSRVACGYEYARNFVGDDKMYHQCRSSQMHNRFFPTSKCTFCTKMGNPGLNSNSILFASDSTELYINSGDSRLWTNIFNDPQHADNGLGSDIYALNDFYNNES